jgi:hypothetical protein
MHSSAKAGPPLTTACARLWTSAGLACPPISDELGCHDADRERQGGRDDRLALGKVDGIVNYLGDIRPVDIFAKLVKPVSRSFRIRLEMGQFIEVFANHARRLGNREDLLCSHVLAGSGDAGCQRKYVAKDGLAIAAAREIALTIVTGGR